MSELKTALVQARMKPEIKKQAEQVFSELGINASTAITLFYTQIIRHQGIPLEIKIPNAETLTALQEDVSSAQKFESIDEFIKDIHS